MPVAYFNPDTSIVVSKDDRPQTTTVDSYNEARRVVRRVRKSGGVAIILRKRNDGRYDVFYVS